MILEALEKLLGDRCTSADIRRIETGVPASMLWQQIDAAGLPDLRLGEKRGGAGMPLPELFPISECLGRFAVPLPIAQSIVARVLVIALDHCNTRVQFGRSIGKFRAIQQQLSVMAEHVLAAAITAESAFQLAGRAPSPLAAASAKSRASEAAALVAATAHAGHRAIGMTDECELGVLTRRLHEWRLSYGAGHYRNQIIGAQLLASASSAVDFARAAWCADAVGSATLVPCQ